MDIAIGTLLLLLVLSLFSLFSFKAPNGMKAMGHWPMRRLPAFGGSVPKLCRRRLVRLRAREGSRACFRQHGRRSRCRAGRARYGGLPVYALLLGAACAGTGLLLALSPVTSSRSSSSLLRRRFGRTRSHRLHYRRRTARPLRSQYRDADRRRHAAQYRRHHYDSSEQ